MRSFFCFCWRTSQVVHLRAAFFCAAALALASGPKSTPRRPLGLLSRLLRLTRLRRRRLTNRRIVVSQQRDEIAAQSGKGFADDHGGHQTHIRIRILERGLDVLRFLLGQLTHLSIELDRPQQLLLLDLLLSDLLLQQLLLEQHLLPQHHLLLEHEWGGLLEQTRRESGMVVMAARVIALAASNVRGKTAEQNNRQRGYEERGLPTRGHESGSSKEGVLRCGERHMYIR